MRPLIFLTSGVFAFMSKLFKTIAAVSSSPSPAPDMRPVNQNGNPFMPAPVRSTNDYTRIVIRDMAVSMRIGAYEFERQEKQPLRINLVMSVDHPENSERDMVGHVVSSDEIISEIQYLAANEDVCMLEGFAENIARFCLSDGRVRDIQVRVEKTEPHHNISSVGVEIFRARA